MEREISTAQNKSKRWGGDTEKAAAAALGEMC